MKSHIENLCIKDLTNELALDEKAILEKWLNQSNENRKKYDQYKEILNMQRSLKISFEPDVQTAWNKFNQSRQKIKRKPLFKLLCNFLTIPWYKPVSVAVGLTLVLILVIFQFNHHILYTAVESKSGEIKELTLPDGSSVKLNNNSTLLYSKKFYKGRKVVLDGEAFFDIIKERRPFIIESREASVKVLGTRFIVWSRERLTRVVVETGRVRLAQKQNNAFVDISTGQMSYIKNDSLPVTPREVELAHYFNWLGQGLEFVNEPLEKIILAIEKQYNISIKCDPQISQKRLSATFKNQPLESVLNSICIALNLKYEKKNGDYYLSRN